MWVQFTTPHSLNQWIHSKSNEITWRTRTPFVVVMKYVVILITFVHKNEGLIVHLLPCSLQDIEWRGSFSLWLHLGVVNLSLLVVAWFHYFHRTSQILWTRIIFHGQNIRFWWAPLFHFQSTFWKPWTFHKC